MPTHKSVRSILDDLEAYLMVDDSAKEKAIDQALAQLAELVRGEKKNEAGNINWNLACEHIAQKLEGKG